MADELATVVCLFFASWVNLLSLVLENFTSLNLPMILTCISTFLSTFVVLLEVARPGFCNNLHPILSPILFTFWIANTGFQTFSQPFLITGNGYFSSWLALFFAANYALKCNSYVAQLRENPFTAPESAPYFEKQKEYTPYNSGNVSSSEGYSI